MHSYLITAKPGWIARACTWLRTWTVRLLALLVMVLLGAAVFTIRCARPVINYLATAAVHIEAWASARSGLPPVGAAVGAGLTAEFVREFRNGWDTPATETT
ncbi:hypothetical protein [Streptomyces lunaelactis]|uniref:hypothetical protein n=1 Tax=Streptomyces lunaelactis TaxID=1535768 RepID=UPI001585A236|nr:hypothetical protein [Streptomyces lunaelactis]NUL14498.1 hypothetical protein [Streptomyces lunaelactis]